MQQRTVKKLAIQMSGAIFLTFAFAVFPISARAQSAFPAQDFVRTNVQAAIGILQDKSLAPDARRERVRAFLLSLLETRRIAMYALGTAQQTASQADIAAYSDAFREFMVAGYDAMLRAYGGQTLQVTGSAQHAPGDFVVTAELIDPSGAANGKTPPEVDFRILDENGKFFIADASVEGVWLALAERNDFQGFLKQHNGDVVALTAHLRDMTAALQQRPATG